MKALSKILVATASLAFAASASAQSYNFEPESGVSYEMIAKCLFDRFGLEDGRHFRKAPGPATKVQFHKGNLQGDSFVNYSDREGAARFHAKASECWKKPAKEDDKSSKDDEKQ